MGPRHQEERRTHPLTKAWGGKAPQLPAWSPRGGPGAGVPHRVQQTHSILALVAAGLGRAIVTDLSLPQDTPGVQAVPLTGAPAKEIVLARKHRPPRSRAAKLFWQTAAREL
ncbi:MAG: LysR substrate-binding domain-containing protein [Leisingera sp.]